MPSQTAFTKRLQGLILPAAGKFEIRLKIRVRLYLRAILIHSPDAK